MEDQVLLRKASKGSTAAFEQLIEPHQKGIYALCLRMTGNHEDAQDMAQETLIRAWRHISRFDGQAALYTWMYRIAVNVCLDELRRRKRRKTVPIDPIDLQAAAPRRDGPEAVAQNAELGEELARLLLRLSEDQRLVILLRDVQGFSYEDIAEILCLNLNTVKSRISRGRQALRQMCAERPELFTTHAV